MTYIPKITQSEVLDRMKEIYRREQAEDLNDPENRQDYEQVLTADTIGKMTKELCDVGWDIVSVINTLVEAVTGSSVEGFNEIPDRFPT